VELRILSPSFVFWQGDNGDVIIASLAKSARFQPVRTQTRVIHYDGENPVFRIRPELQLRRRYADKIRLTKARLAFGSFRVVKNRKGFDLADLKFLQATEDRSA